MTDYLRANLRFLSVAFSLISAMGLFFMLVAWLIGGTSYYKEVLLGDSFMPILVGMMVSGAVGGVLFRRREEAVSAAPAWNT